MAARDSNYPVLTSLQSFAVPQALAAVSASHSDFAFDSGVDRHRSECRRVGINLGSRRGSILQVRRTMAYIGFTGAAGFLILSTRVSDPLMAVLAIGMASFCNDLVMPGAWASAMDIGGTHAGSLSGAMNMC